MLNTVYIHIRHWLFWYGNYEFCEKSSNDEITIYQDKDKKKLLGHFEITTHRSLEYLIDSDEDEFQSDYPELYSEIKDFLQSHSNIHYTYIYPRDKEDVIRQVKHNAPVNDKGLKPIYIEMWWKLSDYWDENEVKKCVKILCEKFFNENIEKVEILDIPTFEETKLSYNEDYLPYIK